MSAELRAQIRSGITGLGITGSRPATAVPVLGDETRRIPGVKEDERARFDASRWPDKPGGGWSAGYNNLLHT